MQRGRFFQQWLWTVGLAAFFLSAAPSPAADELTLQEALKTALAENRDIQYHRIATNIARHVFNFEEAAFLPDLSFITEWQTTREDSALVDDDADRNITETALSLGKEHRSGGRSSINLSTAWDNILDIAPGIDTNVYATSVYLKYEQPLWRGRGPSIARLGIKKAAIRERLARASLELSKNKILFDILKNYYALYRTIEELRLKKDIREKAEKIHDIVAEKVKMRRLPVTDQNQMKATLIRHDLEILGLERRRQEERNRLLLSIYSRSPTDPPADIVLSPPPAQFIEAFPVPALFDTLTRVERADQELIAHTYDILLLDKDIRKAEDDTRPDLTVSVQAGIDGYSSGDWGDSVGDMNGDHYSALVTGSLALPVINRAARSKLYELQGRRRQLEIRRDHRREVLIHAITELIREIETTRKQMALTRRLADIAKENLDSETRRLVAEKSTVLDTLVYHSDFISAELSRLNTALDCVVLMGTYYYYRREMETLVGP